LENNKGKLQKASKMSIFLDAYLWTGDKVLYNGLMKKGFDRVLTTSELVKL
jgi:hypothetical protein